MTGPITSDVLINMFGRAAYCMRGSRTTGVRLQKHQPPTGAHAFFAVTPWTSSGHIEQGEGGWGPVWRNSTKLPPIFKDTLTERHAPTGFDPGLTGWVPSGHCPPS